MWKYYKAILLLTIITAMSATRTEAQVSVTAELDTAAILVGEQVHIRLNVATGTKQGVSFPAFPDGVLTHGVEIVRESSPDTTILGSGERMSIAKTYTITSFEDSLYYLPPFKVHVAGKEYASKSLALKVLTIPVDTLHPEIFAGPKDIVRPAFSWNEWKRPFIISLLWLLAITALILIINKLRHKVPKFKYITIEPPSPAHTEALAEIEKLKTRQNEASSKEYYTGLTDVIRRYISRRFGFTAQEMTSDEIMKQLKTTDNTELHELRSLLETADLVKFAKYKAVLSENDRNLMRAVNFVNETKDETPVEPIVQRVSVEQKTLMRRKWLLRTAAVIVGIVIALLTWSLFSELSKLMI